VVEAADVTYLLETGTHCSPAARRWREDVTSAFAGLRPLIAPPAGAAVAPSSVSREEEIFASPSGLISIAGGKLTTHRLVAAAVVERVIDALRRGGERRRFGRSRTGTVPLPGGTARLDARGGARRRGGLCRGGRREPPAVALKSPRPSRTPPAKPPRRLNVARESREARRARARQIARALARAYPDAWCALHYENPWQLLVATILSAQCTDAMVNQVTPRLFAEYPGPRELAAAPVEA